MSGGRLAIPAEIIADAHSEVTSRIARDERRGPTPNSGVAHSPHPIASRGAIFDMNVAVLIPCYNEQTTIGQVVTDFASALPGARIFVYDNNSSDATVERALAAHAIVRSEKARGKGNVVRRMLAMSMPMCTSSSTETPPMTPCRGRRW
jgi:hypothetical protein